MKNQGRRIYLLLEGGGDEQRQGHATLAEIRGVARMQKVRGAVLTNAENGAVKLGEGKGAIIMSNKAAVHLSDHVQELVMGGASLASALVNVNKVVRVKHSAHFPVPGTFLDQSTLLCVGCALLCVTIPLLCVHASAEQRMGVIPIRHIEIIDALDHQVRASVLTRSVREEPSPTQRLGPSPHSQHFRQQTRTDDDNDDDHYGGKAIDVGGGACAIGNAATMTAR